MTTKRGRSPSGDPLEPSAETRDLRVLLVEDNPGDALLITELLLEADVPLELQRAETLAGAAELLRSWSPDCLLADLNLPDSSGLATVSALQRNAADTPIVVLTGLDDLSIGTAAVAAGAQDYLVKGRLGGTGLHRTILWAIERSRARAALTTHDRWFQDLLATADEGVWALDADGVTTYVNRAMADMLGLSVDDVLGRPAVEFVPHVHQTEFIHHLARRRDGAGEWYEFSFVKPDATEVPVGISASAVFNRDGSFGGSLALIHNLTAQKAAEAELLASHERFHALSLLGSDVTAIVDVEGRIEYVSPSVSRVFGYDGDTLRGATVFDYIHGEDLKAAHAAIRSAVTSVSRLGRIIVRVWRADGSICWSEVTLSNALHVPAIRGLIVNLRDVSVRRAAEEAAHRLAAIVESSDDAILDADTQGLIGSWNAGAQRLLGYTPEEIIGQPVTVLVPPDSRESQARIFRDVLAGKSIEHHTVERLHKDGRRLSLSVSLSPVRQSDGRIVGVGAIARDVTELERARIAQQLSESRLRTLVANAPVRIASFDLDGVITFVDGKDFHTGERTVTELIGQSAWDRYADHPRLRDALRRALAGEPSSVEDTIEGLTWEVRNEPLRDADGNVCGAISVGVNATERLRALAELRASEERFRALVQHASDLIGVVDVHGVLTYASPSVEQVLGQKPEDVVGRPFTRAVHREDLPSLQAWFTRLTAEPGSSAAIRFKLRHHDRSWRQVEVTGTNLLHLEHVSGVVLNIRDITDEMVARKQLEHQALHDQLTGLPNRALFTDRLAQQLATASDGGELAVLLLDLDHFRLINDSYGHDVGDKALRAIANRLVKGLPARCTIARLSGDAFGVSCSHIGQGSSSADLAERVMLLFDDPIVVGRHRLHVTASIGLVTCATEAPSPPDELLRDADIAMHRAKEAGRCRIAAFDPTMHESVKARLELKTELREAVLHSELTVHYQPKVRLPDGAPWAVEALVRWPHPRRGFLSPDEFIPEAEDSGLILPLGRWVLDQACRDVVGVLADGQPLTVAVNLSARQFTDPDLVSYVRSTLAATGLDPGLLCLEITESALMSEVTVSTTVLQELREIGVNVAADDFGTGYSSLAYLKRFPLNYLKIDRSFVAGLGTDPSDYAIAAAITGLAHTLGLDTIGEGVETALQARTLTQLGCRNAQGYLYSPAVPSVDLAATLTRLSDAARARRSRGGRREATRALPRDDRVHPRDARQG